MHSAPSRRQKLIVIHGWGATFVDAVRHMRELFDFEARWHEGAFWVDRRVGGLLRQLLWNPDEGRYLQACRKLVVSRMLKSCELDPRTGPQPDPTRYARFSERHIRDVFSGFGIPLAPAARYARAERLREDALSEVQPIMMTIESIGVRLEESDGSLPTEEDMRVLIREHARDIPEGQELLALLETVRAMGETGGDLDTVASGVLYAHWLVNEATGRGTDLRYGRDYRFVFLNYHESLRHMAQYAPADVFMADLPISAFPHFEEDVRHLHEQGVTVQRFEDHHPCPEEQYAMLTRLVDEGLIGFLDMSGPRRGEEPVAEDLSCAADMVYVNTIEGRPYDCPGARHIRNVAHSEDLVQTRGELGRLLTSLIKGGISKVELAQTMLRSISDDDLERRLRARGWDALVQDWRNAFEDVSELLARNTYLFECRARPATAPAGTVPGTPPANVLVCHAPRTEPGQRRITVGQALEFYSKTVPEADYVFYCYGSSLVVARRLNQDDVTLNLGALMPLLGGPSDGGHSGASVCRPEVNDAYPHRLLGRVDADTFPRFARYLAFRIGKVGYETGRLQNRSTPVSQRFRRGGRHLVHVALAAVIVGLLLALLHSDFRRDRIVESNKTFFPQLEARDAADAEAEESE